MNEVQAGMPFQISGCHGWGGVREFVYDMDEPAFLKRDLKAPVLLVSLESTLCDSLQA